MVSEFVARDLDKTISFTNKVYYRYLAKSLDSQGLLFGLLYKHEMHNEESHYWLSRGLVLDSLEISINSFFRPDFTFPCFLCSVGTFVGFTMTRKPPLFCRSAISMTVASEFAAIRLESFCK